MLTLRVPISLRAKAARSCQGRPPIGQWAGRCAALEDAASSTNVRRRPIAPQERSVEKIAVYTAITASKDTLSRLREARSDHRHILEAHRL